METHFTIVDLVIYRCKKHECPGLHIDKKAM